jgi:hypothetical protein
VSRSRSALLLAALAAVVAPWTAYLALSLPDEHLAPHWRLLWSGLDTAITAAALATLAAVVWRPRRVPVFAAATGTVLVCDAWFDVLTSRGGDERLGSIVLALALELPLAAFCYRLAWRPLVG